MSAFVRDNLRTELWIRQQLKLPNLFTGVCTHEIRRERIRTAILEANLFNQVAGRRNSISETWAEVFERLYQQPLFSADKQSRLIFGESQTC